MKRPVPQSSEHPPDLANHADTYRPSFFRTDRNPSTNSSTTRPERPVPPPHRPSALRPSTPRRPNHRRTTPPIVVPHRIRSTTSFTLNTHPIYSPSRQPRGITTGPCRGVSRTALYPNLPNRPKPVWIETNVPTAGNIRDILEINPIRHPVNHAVSPPDRVAAFRETPLQLPNPSLVV